MLTSLFSFLFSFPLCLMFALIQLTHFTINQLLVTVLVLRSRMVEIYLFVPVCSISHPQKD